LYQVRHLISFLQQFSIPLIVGVFAGLIVANVDQHFYERLVEYHFFGDQATLFGHALTAHFFINGIFMVFFFGIATKEITDALLPGGGLNPVNRAVNPLLSALGGVLGPAGFYLLLSYILFGGTDDFSAVSNGWAIPTATDIALAWLVARLVFGNKHPAVNFLLLLAVVDDGIGLGIIAVFYPDPELPVKPAWLLLTVGGMAVAFAMRRMNIGSWIPYIAIAGAMSWTGLLKASIEPALALVVIVPFLPSWSRSTETFSQESRIEGGSHSSLSAIPTSVHGHSPLELFEHQLKLIVDFGLFFFAFANSGVAFGSVNQITLIVLLSLVFGKIVGITLFSWVAARIGFPLPTGMGMKHLVVAGLIAGIGLTVALFVAGKAFPGPPFQEPAKMGAVLSGVVALVALIAGATLKVKDHVGDSSS
jgi:NhaA family Na+:H+ antiporter